MKLLRFFKKKLKKVISILDILFFLQGRTNILD